MYRKNSGWAVNGGGAGVKSRKLMCQGSIKKYLIGLRKHLQVDRDNADLTVKTHLIGAKSFYHNFYIEIPIFPGRNQTMPFEDNIDIPT